MWVFPVFRQGLLNSSCRERSPSPNFISLFYVLLKNVCHPFSICMNERKMVPIICITNLNISVCISWAEVLGEIGSFMMNRTSCLQNGISIWNIYHSTTVTVVRESMFVLFVFTMTRKLHGEFQKEFIDSYVQPHSFMLNHFLGRKNLLLG